MKRVLSCRHEHRSSTNLRLKAPPESTQHFQAAIFREVRFGRGDTRGRFASFEEWPLEAVPKHLWAPTSYVELTWNSAGMTCRPGRLRPTASGAKAPTWKVVLARTTNKQSKQPGQRTSPIWPSSIDLFKPINLSPILPCPACGQYSLNPHNVQQLLLEVMSKGAPRLRSSQADQSNQVNLDREYHQICAHIQLPCPAWSQYLFTHDNIQ